MSNTITPTVFYRTLNVTGLDIFYREAGPRDAPTVLLLHGAILGGGEQASVAARD